MNAFNYGYFFTCGVLVALSTVSVLVKLLKWTFTAPTVKRTEGYRYYIDIYNLSADAPSFSAEQLEWLQKNSSVEPIVKEYK